MADITESFDEEFEAPAVPRLTATLETGLVLSDFNFLVNETGIYEGLAVQLLEVSYRYRAENQRLRQEQSFFDREMRARDTLERESKKE